MSNNKIILDLCGGTGAWSKPYKDNDYDVRIIDSEKCFYGDIRLFKKLDEEIYGILAAPPCTHFSSSGAMWWKQKGIELLKDSLSVVDAVFRIIYAHQPKFWVLENPVGRLVHYLGKPKHIFNPCDYGDPYTKKTCLWGKFNIPKQNKVEAILGSKLNLLPESKGRAMQRSITPKGFANAFYEANI